jgi:hypothetical protein
MKARTATLAAAAISLAMGALSGCASTSARHAFDDVAQTVHARSGHTLRWNQDTEADKEAERASIACSRTS